MTSGFTPADLPFAEDSALRRMHREGVLLLGGGRALLMQIAHPAVAQGVAEHSSFQHNRAQRLLRTLRPMLAIAFGTREQAEAAAASVNHIHTFVRGNGYRADNPDLLIWVLATLIDTALDMHRRFLGPPRRDEAEAYYAGMQRVGSLLGIPPGAMPADVAAFDTYMLGRLDTLRVSLEAREIAGQIFRPLPPQWTVMLPLRQLTAGLLPPQLRSQFGLAWGPNRERALELLQASSRRVLPRLPMRLRGTPAMLLPPRSG